MQRHTDVDLAEKEKDDAKSLNYNLPKLLSFESNKRDIGFIHISTDYVFGDDKHGPLIIIKYRIIMV